MASSSLGSSPSGGSSSSSHSNMSAMMSARTQINQQQLRYYAAGICGLVAIFVFSHWLRLIFNKFSPSSKNPVRTVSRLVRNVLIRKVPGFTSSGHSLVVLAYVAINLAATLTNVSLMASSIANRCGWMLCANLCLVIFLALKNTPLAILSAYSYERLNGLHQIAGYTTFGYLVLHASMYSRYFLAKGKMSIFESASVKAGIVAGFALLGVFLSAAVIRHVRYELFYALHVLCFLAALVAASLHQPDLAENGLLIMLLLAASMWLADRLVRGSRLLLRAASTHAILEPLPQGGTRITLVGNQGRGGGRRLVGVPGKHCFVWIPAVRLLETHPFTVVATQPMEFVVHASSNGGGFTRALHQYAVAHPGARLRASVDGPYGTFPDPMAFDTVVLLAGGSGATFTFGLAVNLLERMGPDATKRIVFVWAVKKRDNLAWFASHLQTLKTHPHSPKVSISLYVTTGEPSASDSEEQQQPPRIPTTVEVSEKAEPRGGDATTVQVAAAVPTDLEKGTISDTKLIVRRDSQDSGNSNSSSSSSSDNNTDMVTSKGRPDVAALVREAVAATTRDQRVLVAACGPAGLLRIVRDTTASLITRDGPGVELHCEQFGW